MNERLHYGKNTPKSYVETEYHSVDSPYSIRYKHFLSEDIAPIHYGTTFELDLFYGVIGEVKVGNNKYIIAEETNIVVAVPPGTVHSVIIKPNNGYGYVIHISMDKLKAVIDIEALYRMIGKSTLCLSGVFHCFDEMIFLANELIENDEDLLLRFTTLTRIFERLSRYVEATDSTIPTDYDDNYKKILKWTNDNYRRKINIEEAANLVFLSKNYFCNWFKAKSGSTYNNFLNSVRLSKACELLCAGEAVQYACYESGFSDLSYFTQLFKKVYHELPSEYRKRNHI